MPVMLVAEHVREIARVRASSVAQAVAEVARALAKVLLAVIEARYV